MTVLRGWSVLESRQAGGQRELVGAGSKELDALRNFGHESKM